MNNEFDYRFAAVHDTLEAVRAAAHWERLEFRTREVLNRAIDQLSIRGSNITREKLHGMRDQAFMFADELADKTRPTQSPSDAHNESICRVVAQGLSLADVVQRKKGKRDSLTQSQVKNMRRAFAEHAHLTIMTRKGYDAARRAKLCAGITNALLGVRLEPRDR